MLGATAGLVLIAIIVRGWREARPEAVAPHSAPTATIATGESAWRAALPWIAAGLALLLQPAIAAATGWIAYGEAMTALDFAGSAMIMAALVLDEPLSPWLLLGTALVMSGVFICSRGQDRPNSPPPSPVE